MEFIEQGFGDWIFQFILILHVAQGHIQLMDDKGADHFGVSVLSSGGGWLFGGTTECEEGIFGISDHTRSCRWISLCYGNVMAILPFAMLLSVWKAMLWSVWKYLWHRGGNVMAIFLFTVDCHFTWKIAMLWQFFSSLWIVTSLENRNIMVYFKPFELNTTKLLLTWWWLVPGLPTSLAPHWILFDETQPRKMKLGREAPL